MGEVPALLRQAVALHQQGHVPQAQAFYEEILGIHPRHFEALQFLGTSATDTGNPQLAVDLLDRAIAVRANVPEAHYNRANALQDLGRKTEALAGYDRAVALAPNFADAWYNRGILQRELGQPEAALASLERALRLTPEDPEAHFNRALALKDLGRLGEAIASYDRAIALRPGHPESHYNRGNALHDLYRLEEALAAYERAVALNPAFAAAHYNRGNAFDKLKRHEAALASYEQALALNPDFDYLRGVRLFLKLQHCDWEGIDAGLADLAARIDRDEKAALPLHILSLNPSPHLQRRAAETWVSDRHPPPAVPLPPGRRVADGRVRIGYFSADFRMHPVAVLMAGVLEAHDRARFDTTAFAFIPGAGDAMTERIGRAVDRYIDVRGLGDREVAALARESGIDVAINLGGHTQDARTGIFAHRAAPVQVNFLGYPGTMGAPFMDYILADETLVPANAGDGFAEQVARLPSYFPGDRGRAISARDFSRAELGLPEGVRVFCAFNAHYKINPATFDGWMRILARVEGSVLWLSTGLEAAKTNLRRETSKRGVDPARLVFAERMPSMEDHLARHRVADLFLDTLPYNAHTTASDALWAGLPVLTCTGEAFASRVAASLLTAIGLPELVAASQAQFEDLAVDLALHPERLRELKARLEGNRLTAPLFDTVAYTRSLEALLERMHEHARTGQPPVPL